jgi:5-formyltetrahydrofolate cyclo-ligase
VRLDLSAVTASERAEASERACQRLYEQPIWQEAKSVLGYAPLPDELDVFPLLERALADGKAVGLPQFEGRTGLYRVCRITDLNQDLTSGNFGVREPNAGCAVLELKQLDLILVPGVAFDLNGHRLGRGRGFYDRLLRDVTGTKCGVASDEQVKKQIPVEAHDVLLDCILTPGSWLDLRPQRHGDDLVG